MKWKVTLNDTISKVKKYKFILFFLFLNLLFYGGFVIRHYAPDTYFTEATGWHNTVLHYFKTGRWLMSAFSYICETLHIDFMLAQFLSWGLAILSISFSSFLIYGLLKDIFSPKESNSKRIWLVIISFMMVSNVFLLEYFIFAEYTGIMCLGLLFDIIAAKFILRFIMQKKKIDYFTGIAFAILGINGHQGNFAILVIICVICTPDLFANVKSFIWKNLIIGSAYLIPAFTSAIEVRIGGADRVAGSSFQLWPSIVKSTEGLKSLLQTTSNFLPYRFYIFSVGVFGIFFLYYVFKKKTWKTLLHAIYWFIIAALGIYAPLLVTDLTYIDVVPRTVFIMGGIIPLLLIGLLYLDVTPKNNYLLPLFVCVFLSIQYWGILRITESHFQSNAVNRYEAQYIGDYLRNYNETTGTQVTKMALYWDTNVSGYAPGTIGYGAVNERVMSNNWAAPLAIKCHDGYEIQMTATSEEVYETHFKGKDWRQINDEQFYIIGDTLHFCAY